MGIMIRLLESGILVLCRNVKSLVIWEDVCIFLIQGIIIVMPETRTQLE